MKRVGWLLVLSIQVGLAPLASAAPDGTPAHPKSIGLWSQHDPDEPMEGYEPWTPADVVGFLERFPDAFIDLAWGDGKPTGLTKTARYVGLVQDAKSIASQRGVDVAGRMCLSERPDVYTLTVRTAATCHPTRGGGGCDWEGGMNGRLGEAETVVKASGETTQGDATHLTDANADWMPEFFKHRLAVLRPGAGEETRRIVANDTWTVTVDRPWTSPPQAGDRYEIRGSFDPKWVMAVPRSVHQATLARFWQGARNVCVGGACAPPPEPLDPFSSANRRGWEKWIDREGIEAVATPTTVPALYGYAYDHDVPITLRQPGHEWSDPYFRASSVVMDLRNREYRAWRIRYALYKLAEYGFEPGDPACMVVAYKPGYYAHYDEATYGPPTERCSASGTNTWFGPVHVCSDGASIGGPLHPTQYGPGEFESAISAYFRELTSALAAVGRGNTRIITSEAPQFRDRDWTTFADDVRRHPRLNETLGGWIEPRLALLAGATDDEESPVPAAPGEGAAVGDGESPEPGGPSQAETDGGAGGGSSAESPIPGPPGSRSETASAGSGSGGGTTAGSSTGGDAPPIQGGSPVPRAPRASASASATPDGDDPERRGVLASGGQGGGGGVVEPFEGE